MRTYLSSISWRRCILFAVVGSSALVSGVFFAYAPDEKNFAHVEFARVSVVAEIAATFETRTKGLSGRTHLSEFNGMLFVMERPDYAGIWMKDMKIPIDILWISNGTVVGIKEHALPPLEGTRIVELEIYHPDVKANFVLETNAGFAAAHDIRIGDRASITMNGIRYAYAQIDDDGQMHLPTPMPAAVGDEYTIDALRRVTFQGDDFRVNEKIETNEHYTKYAISYRSGDIIISGVMNVPHGSSPAGGFPVLILNHGLIPPSLYTTGRGSKREQDFFSRHGYVTIHPDYQGHASSSPVAFTHHDFYVGYTQDVVSLLDAIERERPAYIDTSRIGMWGHSMGGGIAARVMVLRPEVKAFVLFAPVSADAEDNFFELTHEETTRVHDTYGPAGDLIYRRISPIEYFGDVSAPIQIHVGSADTAVPPTFSEKIYNRLKAKEKRVEFFMYPDEKHEFINDWPLAAGRALQFFDHYVRD